jgi:hypothetical protein
VHFGNPGQGVQAEHGGQRERNNLEGRGGLNTPNNISNVRTYSFRFYDEYNFGEDDDRDDDPRTTGCRLGKSIAGEGPGVPRYQMRLCVSAT